EPAQRHLHAVQVTLQRDGPGLPGVRRLVPAVQAVGDLLDVSLLQELEEVARSQAAGPRLGAGERVGEMPKIHVQDHARYGVARGGLGLTLWTAGSGPRGCGRRVLSGRMACSVGTSRVFCRAF